LPARSPSIWRQLASIQFNLGTWIRRCSTNCSEKRANAIKAEAGAHLPVKRIGPPDEIADAVLFLMKNGYVNGITLTVDGGGLLV
jgi:NAD(P)-dependent dehydrogenase (short-subunit alcohol dehydrogenase family)